MQEAGAGPPLAVPHALPTQQHSINPGLAWIPAHSCQDFDKTLLSPACHWGGHKPASFLLHAVSRWQLFTGFHLFGSIPLGTEPPGLFESELPLPNSPLLPPSSFYSSALPQTMAQPGMVVEQGSLPSSLLMQEHRALPGCSEHQIKAKRGINN